MEEVDTCMKEVDKLVEEEIFKAIEKISKTLSMQLSFNKTSLTFLLKMNLRGSDLSG